MVTIKGRVATLLISDFVNYLCQSRTVLSHAEFGGFSDMEKLWRALILLEVNSSLNFCVLWLSCDFVLGDCACGAWLHCPSSPRKPEGSGFVPSLDSWDVLGELRLCAQMAPISWAKFLLKRDLVTWRGNTVIHTPDVRDIHRNPQAASFSHSPPHCGSALSCGTRKIQTLCFLQCLFHGDKLSSFAIESHFFPEILNSWPVYWCWPIYWSAGSRGCPCSDLIYVPPCSHAFRTLAVHTQVWMWPGFF